VGKRLDATRCAEALRNCETLAIAADAKKGPKCCGRRRRTSGASRVSYFSFLTFYNQTVPIVKVAAVAYAV
jgi:hypothetical protein